MCIFLSNDRDPIIFKELQIRYLTTDLVEILIRCILFVNVNFDTYVTFKMHFLQCVTNKIPLSGSKIREKNRIWIFKDLDPTEKNNYIMIHKNRT